LGDSTNYKGAVPRQKLNKRMTEEKDFVAMEETPKKKKKKKKKKQATRGVVAPPEQGPEERLRLSNVGGKGAVARGPEGSKGTPPEGAAAKQRTEQRASGRGRVEGTQV